jgi:hypothetical protein
VFVLPQRERPVMSALMVQGVSSWAGKSLLTTALARAIHRRGIDVAPFKAQNMSNNARVVAGGEIGTAQYLQALAAGVEPDVRMNPVLIKPEGDSQSQVIVLGRPDLELSRAPWRARPQRLWPVIEQALESLLAEHELMLIEGAGSPSRDQPARHRPRQHAHRQSRRRPRHPRRRHQPRRRVRPPPRHLGAPGRRRARADRRLRAQQVPRRRRTAGTRRRSSSSS